MQPRNVEHRRGLRQQMQPWQEASLLDLEVTLR